MSKKYFNYGFQVKRTKEGLIALIIVIVVAVFIFITWFNNRTTMTKVGALSYKTSFGLNEFNFKDCTKSYRINYKKKTCGTLCVNKMVKNNNYLDELKEEMQEDGFIFNDLSKEKLGNETWNYLKTTNNNIDMNFYAVSTNDSTYSLEYIDQSNSLNKTNQIKCNELIKKFKNSIVLND